MTDQERPPETEKTDGYGEQHPASEEDVAKAAEQADDLETQEGVDTSGPH